MNEDMCVPCGDGLINIRVGAIIIKDGKVLMAGNKKTDYLYSVGGRIKFGETAEEAVVREVLEETGVKMEVERLGFVHENYFQSDSRAKMSKPVYEISLYFYMKTPDDFVPECYSFSEDGETEFLTWVSVDDDIKMFPEFFKKLLGSPSPHVRFVTSDDRIK